MNKAACQQRYRAHRWAKDRRAKRSNPPLHRYISTAETPRTQYSLWVGFCRAGVRSSRCCSTETPADPSSSSPRPPFAAPQRPLLRRTLCTGDNGSRSRLRAIRVNARRILGETVQRTWGQALSITCSRRTRHATSMGPTKTRCFRTATRKYSAEMCAKNQRCVCEQTRHEESLLFPKALKHAHHPSIKQN